MKRTLSGIMPLSALVMFAATAHAGIDVGSVLGGVWAWILDNALAAGLTALGGIGVLSYYSDWFSLLCINVGTFIVNFGLAWTDKKFDKEEVKTLRSNITTIKQTFKAKPKKNG